MKRRAALVLTAAGAAIWPLVGLGQGTGLRRVGYLGAVAESDAQAAQQRAWFAQGLAAQGWTQGGNVEVIHRWIAGSRQIADGYARELIGLRPDVLIGIGTPATAALVTQTKTVPIVFAIVTDPIGDGFVTTLARPDGNVTGFITFERAMGGKWVDMLAQVVPGLRTIAVVFNPDVAPGGGRIYAIPIEERAGALGMEVQHVAVHSRAEIGTAIAALAGRRGLAVLATPDTFTVSERGSLLAEVNRIRLPAIYPFNFFALEGGLMSYGIRFDELVRGAAEYAGRILNGARIADLPVQSPRSFELIVNLKTAQAQGVSIPNTLLALADEVVE